MFNLVKWLEWIYTASIFRNVSGTRKKRRSTSKCCSRYHFSSNHSQSPFTSPFHPFTSPSLLHLHLSILSPKKFYFSRLVEKGHSVSFLDKIPMEGASPKLRAIRFPLPRRQDEEWKNRMAHLLWHERLTSLYLGHYFVTMDKLLGVLLTNGTDTVGWVYRPPSL